MANRIPAELLPTIQRMTNWQRNQWARAKYPIVPSQVARFARLQKDGTELWDGELLKGDGRPASRSANR